MELDEHEEVRHQIRTGSLQHHILKTLERGEPKDAESIWGALLPQKIRLISLDDLKTLYLKHMKASKLLAQVGHTFELTLDGYATLNFLNLKAARRAQSTEKVSRADLRPQGVYLGEELKATCSRAGAYDFLALPSRIGNSLVPHPTAHLAES